MKISLIMSYGAFSSRNSNLNSKKQNEYIMISSLLNDIKNSEKIRMKIYCINDIISEELFNIFHKIVSFYFQLSRLIKNLQSYDKFFKQNKNEINMDIRKFLDKIFILNKSKYNYSIFKIEEQVNFSIFSLKKKKNKIKNKSLEIISNTFLNNEKIKKQETNSIISLFPYENSKRRNNKYNTLNHKNLLNNISQIIYEDNFNKKYKTRNNISLKNEFSLSKKEMNNSKNSLNKTTFNVENSTNKSSISQSKILKNKNYTINYLKKKSKKQEIKKSNEKIKEKELNNNIQLPDLNYLSILVGKKKPEKKIKLQSDSNSPIISNIKLIETGPKPSIYTHYLLNKYKGYIENYNIEEKNQRNNSPYNNKCHSHSICSENMKRIMSDYSQKSIYEE